MKCRIIFFVCLCATALTYCKTRSGNLAVMKSAALVETVNFPKPEFCKKLTETLETSEHALFFESEKALLDAVERDPVAFLRDFQAHEGKHYYHCMALDWLSSRLPDAVQLFRENTRKLQNQINTNNFSVEPINMNAPFDTRFENYQDKSFQVFMHFARTINAKETELESVFKDLHKDYQEYTRIYFGDDSGNPPVAGALFELANELAELQNAKTYSSDKIFRVLAEGMQFLSLAKAAPERVRRQNLKAALQNYAKTQAAQQKYAGLTDGLPICAAFAALTPMIFVTDSPRFEFSTFNSLWAASIGLLGMTDTYEGVESPELVDEQTMTPLTFFQHDCFHFLNQSKPNWSDYFTVTLKNGAHRVIRQPAAVALERASQRLNAYRNLVTTSQTQMPLALASIQALFFCSAHEDVVIYRLDQDRHGIFTPLQPIVASLYRKTSEAHHDPLIDEWLLNLELQAMVGPELLDGKFNCRLKDFKKLFPATGPQPTEAELNTLRNFMESNWEKPAYLNNAKPKPGLQ